MSAGTDDMLETPTDTPKPPARTRPFYWSVRREFWENRSLVVAPAGAACAALIGYLIGALYLPRITHHVNVNRGAAATAAHPGVATVQHTPPTWHGIPMGKGMHMPSAHEALFMPYDFAAATVIFTGVIVALFYCLGALNTERRDRSILFWKSLPVSDLTTVLSKAAVPLLVMPVVLFAITVASQIVMLLLNAGALAAHGKSAVMLLTDLPLVVSWAGLAYSLVILALWHAPIYGWLLLVSGWARRATFLWAILPPLALCLIEWLAFQTRITGQILGERLAGAFSVGFSRSPGHEMVPDPVKFLSAPQLWAGLVVAAAFLAVAVWQRRYREPT